MYKKIICLLLAAALAFAFCACAAPKDEGQKPDDSQRTDDAQKPNDAEKPDGTSAAVTAAPEATGSAAKPAETPSELDGSSYFEPSETGAEAFDSADPEAVLISFSGLVDAQLTAEQLSGMDIYDYSESAGPDTPVYSGPLVSEVLRMAGASGASVITVELGGMTMDFKLSDFDQSTAIFAVIRDGKLMNGSSVFICTTNDGFNYLFEISTPYILK